MKDKTILIAVLVLAVVLRESISWSLFFSVASIAAIWYLVDQLFPEQRLFKGLSAFFLAISPWHIRLVTQPIETNLAIMLSIIGTLILIKIFKDGKWLYIWIALFILMISQLAYPLNLNLANAQDAVWLTDQQRREHGTNYNSFVALAFHNKAVNYSLSLLEHWGEHFSGDFLFITSLRGTSLFIQNPTLMYLADILFLIVGFFNIFRKGDWKNWGVILLWLALAPINSAFNFGPPDFVKAALMVVPLVIISSFGAFVLFERIQTYLKDCTIKK